MTDDARQRALAENARRSRVMADAQRYGPPAPRTAGSGVDLLSRFVASQTESFVRYRMSPAVRRQYQPIALRVLAEHDGRAPIADVRRAIQARHPDQKWDRRYPLEVLRDNGIIDYDRSDAWLTEVLDADQTASLLRALDERAVRTTGLRVEDTSWRPDAPEWAALRELVAQRDGEVCAVEGCTTTTGLDLDHIWRGSLLAAVGWSPAAINNPVNLQLLCTVHHAQKTAEEARLLPADSDDGLIPDPLLSEPAIEREGSCTPTDHDEWTQLRDDHGRPLALACPRCMATVPVPTAEPGVRLVALPPEWEDHE